MSRPGLVRMRVAWSTAALLAVLRRWAGFLIVAMAVLGIGYFVAAIGWPALPVLWASTVPWPEGLVVLAAHASIASGLAWGLRESLLPSHWLQAERALPLRWTQRSLADLAVVAIAQSPLFLLYAASLLSWRRADPAWLHGQWNLGVSYLSGSMALSLAGATALLALRRRTPRQGSMPGHTFNVRRAERVSPVRALILMPAWRGPARPVAAALALTLAALAGCLLMTALWPAEPRWFLAAYALVAMSGSARVHALAVRCLGPLLDASRSLPIPPRFGPRAMLALALAPALLAWPFLAVLLLAGPWRLAPLAGPAYLAAAVLAPAVQCLGASDQAEPRAARWMLCLVLWVALATEILR